MLQKTFFSKFQNLDYIYYTANNIIIFEQFLRKDYKIFFCKFYYIPQCYHTHLLKLTNYYIYSIVILWLKLIFRGKGYRMRRFKGFNKLTFNFGRSHWTKYMYNRDFFFTKKFRRQKIMCFIRFSADAKLIADELNSVKPLNIYTKRGLRWKKQPISRRFGKISQVVSLLH